MWRCDNSHQLTYLASDIIIIPENPGAILRFASFTGFASYLASQMFTYLSFFCSGGGPNLKRPGA